QALGALAARDRVAHLAVEAVHLLADARELQERLLVLALEAPDAVEAVVADAARPHHPEREHHQGAARPGGPGIGRHAVARQAIALDATSDVAHRFLRRPRRRARFCTRPPPGARAS